MKIVILDDYEDVVRNLNCFRLLDAHDVKILNHFYDDTKLLTEMITDAEVIVLIRERTKITEELITGLSGLKLISQTGKVSNHINPEMCRKYGVAVCEGVGSPVAPAELCWGLILAASRLIPDYSVSLQQGKWQHTRVNRLGRTLAGHTMGIWGYGKIGKRVAGYACAFGMKVLIWGSEKSREQAATDGFSTAHSKEEFFRNSDILSLHLRLSHSTAGIVKKDDLDIMKPDSIFVNISRSELLERNALFEVMKNNPSRYAALDVFDNEPALPETEGLLRLPNVLCTPHLGYVEKNSYELYFRAAFENLIAFSEGKPCNIVN